MATIEEVRANHVDELMDRPGVVSVGLGLDDSGNPAIVVGLSRAQQEGEPAIPAALEGHPVVVQVIGEIRPR